MMSSKNNSFTASDIERYHAGTMSAVERHALEKAALDDPFLADALEGYAFSSTPSADLAKIQSRLDEKLNRKKIVPIFQKYRWLSVAAIVLIIAGAGWLAVFISKNENKSFNVAKKESQTFKDSDRITVPESLNDSVKFSQGLANQQTSEPSQGEADLRLTETNNSPVPNNGKQLSQKKPRTEREKEIIQEIATPVTAEHDVASEKNLFKAEQQNISRINSAPAEPKANMASDAITNRSSAKEKASNNAPLSGRVSGIYTPDTIKNINVVLQPLPADSSSLQEVVVGYGSKKKSTDKYPRVIIDTLEPAEGYVKFDDYVANNLKMPDELKTKPISGEVQLSFDVDKDGQPVNITVVKSLCEKCDEEAIRLLKDGPKWKKKKNKKGKVTIKF